MEIHKNTGCCLEQILEATPHKTAAVWPPASHLTIDKNKKGMLEKKGKTSK